jgi:CubicO group peptidase (beta-lactamase class C family)
LPIKEETMHRSTYRIAALATALALAVGATAPVAAAIAADRAATAAPAPASAPTPAAVARYAAQLLAKTYDPAGPGAAVLVKRGDQVLYRGAIGRADVAAATPLSADGMFRIGSVTKQFAAAGVLRLVEQGKVALSDPLSKYVPGYPNGDAVTVRQLLNHTSGIRSYTSMPGIMDGPIQRDLTTPQLIDVFKNEKPDFAPGEGWLYNNSGYVLVGAVIEAASGMPWHQYLHEQFFAPLGMTHTGYGHDPAVVARQVHGYSWEGDKVVDARPISMTQPHAAGALVSSVDDLHTWNRALHEGRVLQDASYLAMITPQDKAMESMYGYGLVAGTVRGAPMLSHGGGIFGFSTTLNYVPGDDISVVVLQNADGARGNNEGPSELARRIAAFALGDPYPTATPIAVDAATLKQYEGVYRIDAKTTRTLRVVDGKLTGQRTGGQRAQLIPIAKDSFLYEDGFNRFDVLRDATGKITAMRFYPEGEGLGTVVALSNEPLPADRAAIELPAPALQRLVGRYEFNGMPMVISVADGALHAQLGSQPVLPLKAESADRFYPTVVDATLEFTPASGTPDTVTLHQNGRQMAFKRSAN